MKIIWLCALALLLAVPAAAVSAAGATAPATGSTAPSHYQPRALFAPFRYQYPVNRYRSGDGEPGPDYWQNRADYEIHATLDPKRKTLTGSEVITYTNNSPHALGYVWVQLDQNRYRSDARANFSGDRAPKFDQHTAGDVITGVEAEVGAHTVQAHYVVSDTRMRVDLPQPIAAHGGKLRLHIAWHYTVPGAGFGGRTDWLPTKNGDIFEMAQWYPRMCVYDDLRGWDTAPYLDQEFYLGYGNFDYYITVPANMLVVGSGELMNPDQVLTRTEVARLAQARQSETTVFIRKPGEVTDPASRPHGGPLTWHFRMHDTRDVAFGASAAYVWDAARIDLPDGKHALAQSAYPVESIAKDGWQNSTQYVKYTVEYFSKYLGFDYPWPNAIAEAGIVGGMEYPGIVFDWWKATGKGLFMLTVHEIGHTWFPMIVGSNERRDAFMDEGFNTFVDVLAQAHYGHGQFAPKQDGEYAPLTGDPAKDIVTQVFDQPDAPPILTRADLIPEKFRHPVTYFKAAYGLTLLRDQILGPERFDAALRQYVADWAFKHPSPSDFFRLMDSASGEDLSWFWRGWFRHNWKLDLAVTGIRYIDHDPAKGALVTVANLDRMAMPAMLQVTYADGSTREVRVPVATWMQHTRFDVPVPGTQRIIQATIDPDHVLPDVNRANDTFTPGAHAGR